MQFTTFLQYKPNTRSVRVIVEADDPAHAAAEAYWKTHDTSGEWITVVGNQRGEYLITCPSYDETVFVLVLFH